MSGYRISLGNYDNSCAKVTANLKFELRLESKMNAIKNVCWNIPLGKYKAKISITRNLMQNVCVIRYY